MGARSFRSSEGDGENRGWELLEEVVAVVFALSKPSVSAEGAPTAWGESPMMWEDANRTEASESQRSHLQG